MIDRRKFLGSTALASLLASPLAFAENIQGGSLPRNPGAGDPPTQVLPGEWTFFTAAEGRTVEAIVERLIPADDLSVRGVEAGCVVFIDRQLAGDFGDATWLYMRPPFRDGLEAQGDQSPLPPAARYRLGLAALDAFCRQAFSGTPFAGLAAAERDDVLRRMERGEVAFEGQIRAADLFKLLLQNTMEGFFADPVYNGNRDMVSWRMVGFPGARYDFRDHVANHNQRYPLPPVSIMGRPEWAPGSE